MQLAATVPSCHVLQGEGDSRGSRGNSDKLSSPAFLHKSAILALCSERSHKDGCISSCPTLFLSCCLTLSYPIATSWIYHNPLVDVKEKQWFKVRSLCTNHTGPDCELTWNQWKQMGRKMNTLTRKGCCIKHPAGQGSARCCLAMGGHTAHVLLPMCLSYAIYMLQSSAVLEKPQGSYAPTPEFVQIIYRPELILLIQKSSSFSQWPRWPWVAQRALWNRSTAPCLQHTWCSLLLKHS